MKVICLLLLDQFERRQSLAEACLAFSPQIAVGKDAVFLEIEGSRHLFSPEECIRYLQKTLQLLNLKARISLASSVPAALTFARYECAEINALPVEALSDFLQPFAPTFFSGAEVFRKLGVATIGDFKKIPRAEIPARFGKQGLLAYERLLEAERIAWPRWTPEEKLLERVDFDCAAQIEIFEPVHFLLKTAFQRIFLRLYARRKKLAAFTVEFHLNKFSKTSERISAIQLPIPQGEWKSVLALASERLTKELENHPLEDALEGISVLVTDTAPFPNTQRDFFSKNEEEQEAWASLVGRLQERLGNDRAFLAAPTPRLLPEASWIKTLNKKERGVLVDSPLRPLRLLNPPQRLQRVGDCLAGNNRRWRLIAFHGPEKLQGEWWLGGFEREYFRVETESGESLWVFTAPNPTKEDAPRTLWLHGIYD